MNKEGHFDIVGYDMPIGPLPQQVTNDLKSLDEMVSEFIPLSIHFQNIFMPEGSCFCCFFMVCTYEVPHIEKWPVNMTHEPVSNMQGVNS